MFRTFHAYFNVVYDLCQKHFCLFIGIHQCKEWQSRPKGTVCRIHDARFSCNCRNGHIFLHRKFHDSVAVDKSKAKHHIGWHFYRIILCTVKCQCIVDFWQWTIVSQWICKWLTISCKIDGSIHIGFSFIFFATSISSIFLSTTWKQRRKLHWRWAIIL